MDAISSELFFNSWRFKVFIYIFLFNFSYCLKKIRRTNPDDKKQEEQLKMAGFRLGKDGNTYKCRFKFPKEVIGYEHTFEETTSGKEMIVNSKRFCKDDLDGAKFQVMEENPSKMEFKMLRNHPTVNNHIPEITLLQRANTDWTIVRTQEQAEEYLTKVT